MNMMAKCNMIKQQLRTTGVVDDKILSLFESTPRKVFVPETYESCAYADMQIPISKAAYMMTPTEEALLLQSLKLTGQEVVLEVGTGSGFLSAMLSQLCKKVVTIEIDPKLAESAKKKLDALGYTNIESHTGNAYEGWVDSAPYDRIIFTGATPSLKKSMHVQLQSGGKIFAIHGKGAIMQAQLHSLQADKTWKTQLLYQTCLPSLVPLHAAHSFVF